ALMPITVSIQLASEVASKSVGEKEAPSPWLSGGASVIISTPDRVCAALVLSEPAYTTFDVVAILFLFSHCFFSLAAHLLVRALIGPDDLADQTVTHHIVGVQLDVPDTLQVRQQMNRTVQP